MQQAQKRVAAGSLGTPQSGLPVKTPEQLVTLASIIEKETGKAGRAHARRRGVRQPAAAEDEAAIRSDHHLRAGRRQGNAGPADQAQRDPAADAVQYLCDRRAAAGTDRQSRPRLARSRGQSGAHQRACSSSPTVPAATPSPKPTSSIRRTSPSCARWKSKFRTTPWSRPTIRRRSGDCACRRRACRARAGKTGRAEKARAPPGRGAIDHGASGGPAIAAAGGEVEPNSTLRKNVLWSRRQPRESQVRIIKGTQHDGAFEHDRFCPKPRCQRTVRVRVGIEVGQCQGLRPAHAAAAGMGRTRSDRQEARRRTAVARHGICQSERQASECRRDRPRQ